MRRYGFQQLCQNAVRFMTWVCHPGGTVPYCTRYHIPWPPICKAADIIGGPGPDSARAHTVTPRVTSILALHHSLILSTSQLAPSSARTNGHLCHSHERRTLSQIVVSVWTLVRLYLSSELSACLRLEPGLARHPWASREEIEPPRSLQCCVCNDNVDNLLKRCHAALLRIYHTFTTPIFQRSEALTLRLALTCDSLAVL